MTMKRWYLAGSILFLLLSCETSKDPIQTLSNPLIVGKATPIQLGMMETIIQVEDYVLEPNRIDSVTTDGPFSIAFDGSLVTLQGKAQKPLYELIVWAEGLGESILLRRVEKTSHSFHFSGDAESVKVKGEFNAWNPNNTILKKQESDFKGNIQVNPGTYQYVMVVDGQEIRDPSNTDSVSNGMGGWNSVLRIPDADENKLPMLKTVSYTQEAVKLQSSNSINRVYAYWGNYRLPSEYIDIKGKKILLQLPANASKVDRSNIRVWAENEEGVSNDVLIPLHFGEVLASAQHLTRKDHESMVMYFLMVDRFRNGDAANDKPLNIPEVHPKADYFGGDLTGITKKIEDGYFEWLGTNTVWLSPITQNPEGAFGRYPEPKTSFSAYHGYWPISNVKVDDRFGTADELKTLVSSAHNSNMNVLLDYVANHVHEQHPIYQNNPDWATDLYLEDGTLNTEKWDEHRLTTWFDTFLPTLDLSRLETVDPLTDSALFWLREYKIDGFRHDATKHIPEIFWRVLTKKIKEYAQNNDPVFQIGETYGSHELIKSYINTGMLDAQFDFNMYDQAVSAFADENGSLKNLAGALKQSIKYYGDHNLMGYITGNQDRPRFISYADGSLRFGEDTKYAGWNRDIVIQDTLAYQKLSALTAYMMVIPGVPCLYYGDEYGAPGGNDPDNRRQMRFDNLDRHQVATRDRAKKLVALRRNNLALIYGDTEVIKEDKNLLIIQREYFSEKVVAVFNTSQVSQEIEMDPSGEINFYGQWTGSGLRLPPNSFDIITYSN